jgi:hypothetical protein
VFDGELVMQPESATEDAEQLVQLTNFMKLSNLVRCR